MVDLVLQYGIIATLAAASLFVIGGFVVFSTILRRNPASLGLIVSCGLWALCQALGYVTGDIGAKLVLLHIEYGLLGTIPLWVILTALFFARLGSRIYRFWFVWIVLALGTAAVFVLLIGNPANGLLFGEITLRTDTGRLQNVKGPLYPVYLLYIISGILTATVILLRVAHKGHLLQKRRAGFVITAISLPLIGGIVEILRLGPISQWPLTHTGIIGATILLAYGIRTARLLSPVPFAHEALVNAMQDPVLVCDTLGRIAYANPAAVGIDVGRNPSVGTQLDRVFPELRDLSESGDPVEQHIRIGNHDFSVYRAKSAMDDPDQAGVILVFHDITNMHQNINLLEESLSARNRLLEDTNTALELEVKKSKEAHKILGELLAEKELLLQELHHRVKNNLQIIISLINLQTSRMGDDSLMREACSAMKHRIRSISLVHERMYRSSFFSGVDFVEYVKELVNGVAALYEVRGASASVIAPERMFIASVDFAVDFGLVLNELITNAFKHAIQPRGAGSLLVTVDESHGRMRLSVYDDGPGFHGDVYGPSTETLGLGIVKAMVKKYDAEIFFTSENGAHIDITIKFESGSIEIAPEGNRNEHT